jgi:WD40 repeat protein
LSDSQCLISSVYSGYDNILQRWDLNTGKCLQTYVGHQDLINTISTSPDGQWVITGSDDKTLKRWDLDTGKCLQTYVGHEGGVNTVAIGFGGIGLFSGSADEIKIWESETGECIKTITSNNWGRNMETISIKSNKLLIVTTVGKKLEYKLEQKDLKCIGHREVVTAVAVSSDGSNIASCGGDEIKIWDVETGECIRTISNKPCGGMRIGGAIGLTSGQIESLKALGAVDD